MDCTEIGVKADIKDLCRICLQISNDGCDLFSDEDKAKDTLEKIYLCFQIILNCENYLPRTICSTCSQELNMANNFRLKCISFEERFQNCLQFKRHLKESDHSKNYPISSKITQEEILEASEESEQVVIDSEVDFVNSNESFGNYKQQDLCNKTFQCDLCHKILKSKSSLLKHNISMHQKRRHMGKVTGFGSARRYHCTGCSYSTPHSQTLVNHMRRHDGERPYHCECGKSFTQSSSLAAHQKIHSNTTYFTCSLCGKQFKHAFTLKNHLRVHENGNLSCSICQKALKSKQSMKDHMHRHYNIRNYNCEECGDTFVTSSELLNHRKKHTSNKSVECHLCGYKTHTKKNMIIHLKRHAGDKSFKCDVCEVTFYTRGDLRRHQRVHTREKPFSCPTCAQRFTHSPSLNKHMQTVHGIEYKWGDFKFKEIRKIKSSIKPNVVA